MDKNINTHFGEGSILNFDLQKFAATTVKPTVKIGDLKDGSTITVNFVDNDFEAHTATFTYNKANNSFSETHSGRFIDAARARIENETKNIIIQFYYGVDDKWRDPEWINTITLNTYVNRWDLSECKSCAVSVTCHTYNHTFAFNDKPIGDFIANDF